MTYATIRLEIDAVVATLTLDRPDKLNAFTQTMHAELAQAITAAEAGGARVLVVTGAGRGFCAGQDLAERQSDAPRDLGETLEHLYNPLVRRLRDTPLAVVAAVNGVAAGAGMSLVLAADIAVAARAARFMQAFVRIGLAPDAGSSWLLPRRIGEARARALALLGESITAEQAEAWGLVWRTVDDDRFAETVRDLAARLAAAPPRAIAAIKRLFDASGSNGLDAQLDLEMRTQRELGFTEDYREGVAAFLAKRPARFTGR